MALEPSPTVRNGNNELGQCGQGVLVTIVNISLRIGLTYVFAFLLLKSIYLQENEAVRAFVGGDCCMA